MEIVRYVQTPFPLPDAGKENEIVYSREGDLFINKTLCDKLGVSTDEFFDRFSKVMAHKMAKRLFGGGE